MPVIRNISNFTLFCSIIDDCREELYIFDNDVLADNQIVYTIVKGSCKLESALMPSIVLGNSIT